jgi:uncharacterized membrane protein YoaK (UPF0700 family)
MRKLRQFAFPALALLIGIGFGYFVSHRSLQKSRFYETITITYDGEQYHTEAYINTTRELRRWLSEEADPQLRNNVLEIVVYPCDTAGMVVGSELRQFNTEHLNTLSAEAHSIISSYPRRRAP